MYKDIKEVPVQKRVCTKLQVDKSLPYPLLSIPICSSEVSSEILQGDHGLALVSFSLTEHVVAKKFHDI